MTDLDKGDLNTRVRSIAGACLLAGFLGWGAAALWGRARDEGSAPALADWPPFPVPAAACSEARPHAEHGARTALETARARMQRYPFAPRDGRDALARFAEAVECARLSAAAGLQAEAAAELARVHERIGRDAREHAQRYLLLRRRDRVREAEADIVFLTELGWPEHGELADELRRDRLQLEDEAREARR